MSSCSKLLCFYSIKMNYLFMFCQEWCCFYVYCGVRGHFVTHSLGIYGSNLTNVTDVGLYWSGHVIWEYIWRLMYTRETPHKSKLCDLTSIIASHLKRHNEKDARFISEYINSISIQYVSQSILDKSFQYFG